jgi:hypothetical protein
MARGQQPIIPDNICWNGSSNGKELSWVPRYRYSLSDSILPIGPIGAINLPYCPPLDHS